LAYLAALATARNGPVDDAAAAATATGSAAGAPRAPRSLDTLLDEFEDRQRRRGPEEESRRWAAAGFAARQRPPPGEVHASSHGSATPVHREGPARDLRVAHRQLLPGRLPRHRSNRRGAPAGPLRPDAGHPGAREDGHHPPLAHQPAE